jgi:hypothetical protein
MKYRRGTPSWFHKVKRGESFIAAASGLVLIVSGIAACDQGQDTRQEQSGAQLESPKQTEGERLDKKYKVEPETAQKQKSPPVQDRQQLEKPAGTEVPKRAQGAPEDKPVNDGARLPPKELRQQ